MSLSGMSLEQVEKESVEQIVRNLKFGMEAVTDNTMAEVARLAQKQIDLETEIEQMEAELAKKKKALQYIQSEQFPELLQQIGLDSVTTSDGLIVTIKQETHAKITKDKAPLAYKWMREHGGGKLIKRSVGLDFAREPSDELIKAIQAAVEEVSPNVTPTINESVHHMSLKSWVEEQLRTGVDLPLKLFGVFLQKSTKIKFKGT